MYTYHARDNSPFLLTTNTLVGITTALIGSPSHRSANGGTDSLNVRATIDTNALT